MQVNIIGLGDAEKSFGNNEIIDTTWKTIQFDQISRKIGNKYVSLATVVVAAKATIAAVEVIVDVVLDFAAVVVTG